jgi:hypothetical protein
MVVNLALSQAGVFGNRRRAIQQVVGESFTLIFDGGLASKGFLKLPLRTDQHAPPRALSFSHHGNTSV